MIGLLIAVGIKPTVQVTRIVDDYGEPLQQCWFPCPWIKNHTTTDGEKDFEVWQWKRGSRWPTAGCLHGHCQKRNRIAVLRWLVDERGVSIATIKKFCREIQKKLPRSETARALIDENPPLPEEIIKRLLHKGLKMMLVGPSKMRKAWLALDLAICLAQGLSWLEFSTSQDESVVFESGNPARVFCPTFKGDGASEGNQNFRQFRNQTFARL